MLNTQTDHKQISEARVFEHPDRRDCIARYIKTIFINKLFINKPKIYQFFYLSQQVVFWND